MHGEGKRCVPGHTAVNCREGWGELEKFENKLHESIGCYSHCVYLKQ